MKKSYRCLLISTVIAALGGLLFGFDTAVISGTTESIQQYFNLGEFHLFNGYIRDIMGWNVGEFWLGFTVSTALMGTIMGPCWSAALPKYGAAAIPLSLWRCFTQFQLQAAPFQLTSMPFGFSVL